MALPPVNVYPNPSTVWYIFLSSTIIYGLLVLDKLIKVYFFNSNVFWSVVVDHTSNFKREVLDRWDYDNWNIWG